MKGIIVVFLLLVVLWGFWMSRKWLMNPKRGPLFGRRDKIQKE